MSKLMYFLGGIAVGIAGVALLGDKLSDSPAESDHLLSSDLFADEVSTQNTADAPAETASFESTAEQAQQA